MTDQEIDELARKYGGQRSDASPLAQSMVDPVDEIAAKYGGKPISTGEDMAKAAAYAPGKAATAMLGFAGDMRDLGKMGRDKVASWLPDMPPWLKNADEFARNLHPMNALLKMAPTSGEIRAPLEQLTGKWYEPQTRAGKLVDTGVQTAATLGRNWLTKPFQAAAMTAGVTGGTEAAGAMSGDNPWARLLGGVVGGGGVAGVSAYKNAPANAVRRAMGPITPEEVAAAVERQNQAARNGVPLMGPESLPDSGIQQLASDVNASRGGAAVTRPFLAKRPDQIRSAVTRELLDSTRNSDTPANNAARAQTAATDVVRNAEQQRSAHVAPDYAAAQFETIRPETLRPVANEIQRLMFGDTIGAPSEKALGGWYKQAFPHEVPAVAFPPEPKPLGPGAMQHRAKLIPDVDPAMDDGITAIRKMGGITPTDEAVGSLAKKFDFQGHPQFGPVWSHRTGGSRSQRGHSLDVMAQFLEQHGYPVSGPDDVMRMIESAHQGRPTYAVGRDLTGFGASQDPMVAINETLTNVARALNGKKQPAAIRSPDLGVGAALPETNVGRLGNLYKQLGIEGDTSAIGVTQAEKLAAYPAQQVQTALGKVLKENSPNMARGQQKYADFTESVVDPLKAGPVGKMATSTGFDRGDPANVARVTASVADVNSVRPEDIRTIYTHLNGQDPKAFPGIARTWLENEFDAATKRVQAGDNRMMGANFAKGVHGTDQQRANMAEVLRGVAHANGVDPNVYVQGAEKLFQTLEATGRIPGVGSPTAGRINMQAELGKSVTADVASAFSSRPFGWLTDRIRSGVLAGREAQLAELFTRPDSVQAIAKFAKLNPKGVTAQFYLATLLGLDRAASGPN